MANKNSLLDEKLKELEKQKEEVGKNKKEVVNNIVTGEDSEVNFKEIANQLKERKENEAESLNDPNLYVKDTIYIEKDIYEAFNALCLKRGDKKQFTNEALRDYVKKKYKELQK